MNYVINFVNGEWEVKFNDGYRIWFDGDVAIEIVATRAAEVAQKRANF